MPLREPSWSLGEILRTTRYARGWDLADVVRALWPEKTERAVRSACGLMHRWENNQKAPSLDSWRRLLSVYGPALFDGERARRVVTAAGVVRADDQGALGPKTAKWLRSSRKREGADAPAA